MFLLLYQTKIITRENFRKHFNIVQLHGESFNIINGTNSQSKKTRAHNKPSNEKGTVMETTFSHLVSEGPEITAQNAEAQDKGAHQIEFCKQVNLVRTEVTSETWQPIVPNDSYVYSAYIDNRFSGTSFTLITIENGHHKRKLTSYCHLWYKNKALPMVVQATIEYWLGTGYR